jgi:asparagine N-glycosylation enzyme membrane subunit Stt3
MGETMDFRTLFLLCASLAILLPSAAWAGSGGPITYTILGLLVVVILMLAAVLRKIK